MKDKVAVILGGNSGIGAATAMKLDELGAQVVIFARDKARNDAVLSRLGPKADAVAGSIDNSEDVDRLMQRVGDRYGRIDILFVNAGVAGAMTIEDTTEEQFDAMFNVNVKGGFFCVQKALPLLPRGASVIFNTSIANQVGTANFSVYSATKGAVGALMRALAVELSERGIFVNAVSPGMTRTPIFESFGMNKEQIEAMVQAQSPSIPAKRFAQPEDIADAVAFIASSQYLMGQEVIVDGGASITMAG